MSHRDTIQTGVLDHLTQTVADLRQRLALFRYRRRAFDQTYSELSQLSDRELNDLGFARADIARIARESADEATRTWAEGRR